MPPILISMFNHKGGIGKTTATYNIGFILSQLGKRVLLVDADPQASLTSLIFADTWQDPNNQQAFYVSCERSEKEGIYRTVPDIFRPMLAEEPEIPRTERSKNVQLTKIHDYKNFYLLPGHLDTGSLDGPAELGLGNVALYKKIPRLYSDLFRQIGIENNIDIIIFDLSPSIGAMNRSLIMFSDYLCVPFFADYLSYQAVQSVFRQVADSWLRKFSTATGLTTPPTFLGVYPQRIKLRKDSKTEEIKYVEAYGNWIRKTYQAVEENINLLRRNHMLSETYQFIKATGIEDFQGVGLDVQASGRPICDLAYFHQHQVDGESARAFKKDENDRKAKAFQSFKKIVGILFRNLKPEHREVLGEEFMRSIDINAVVQEDLVLTEFLYSPLHTSEELSAEDRERAFYTHEQIQRLLRHYCGGSDERLVLDAIQGDGAFAKRGQLASTLRDSFRLLIDGNTNQKTIFVPLNLGENHWVLTIIYYSNEMDDQHKKPRNARVFYYDPLGSAISKELRETLHDIFRPLEINSPAIDELSAPHQRDGYNCGPWIIEFARLFTPNKAAEFPPRDINVSRHEHMQTLAQLDARQQEEAQSLKRRKRRRSSSSQLSPSQSAGAGRFFPTQPHFIPGRRAETVEAAGVDAERDPEAAPLTKRSKADKRR